MQGVVRRMLGNENSGYNEDSYVEWLLDRLSNVFLAVDREFQFFICSWSL